MATYAIKESKNYDMFELHTFNRDIGSIKHLKNSMAKHGFIAAKPIAVFKNGNGKFKILDGHHRFHVARLLGLPVKYIEIEKDISMYELEKTTNHWSLKDYLDSFIRQGKEDYVRVKDFYEYTGIPVQLCVTLLSGKMSSGATGTAFKDGKFRLGNVTDAYVVGDLVNHCKKFGIPCATHRSFAIALARIVKVKGFDCETLKHKIATFPGMITNQPNVKMYSKMIEDVYNFQSRKKLPLAFLAEEAAKERSPIKKERA